MLRKSARLVITAACFALSVQGCVRPPLPVISGDAVLATERQAVFDALYRADDEVKSFRGLARVKSIDGKGSSYRQTVLFEKPDRFRIEALPLDSAYTLYLVVAANGTLKALNPPQREAISSLDERALFARLTKLPLGTREMMSLLIGRVPPTELHADTEIYRPSAARVLYLKNRNFTSYYVLDADTLRIVQAEFRNQFSEELVARIEYSYENGPVAAFPARMTLTVPDSNDASARFQWTMIKVNDTLPANLFEVAISDDYSVRKLTSDQ